MQKKKEENLKIKTKGLQAHCSYCTEAHNNNMIFLALGWQVGAVSVVANVLVSDWHSGLVLFICMDGC